MTNQANQFKAAMADWGEVLSENTKIQDASGSAMERMEIYADSLEGKISTLKAAWEDFVLGLNLDDAFGTAIDLATDLIKVLDTLFNDLGPLSTLFKTGLGVMVANTALGALSKTVVDLKSKFGGLLSGFINLQQVVNGFKMGSHTAVLTEATTLSTKLGEVIGGLISKFTTLYSSSLAQGASGFKAVTTAIQGCIAGASSLTLALGAVGVALAAIAIGYTIYSKITDYAGKATEATEEYQAATENLADIQSQLSELEGEERQLQNIKNKTEAQKEYLSSIQDTIKELKKQQEEELKTQTSSLQDAADNNAKAANQGVGLFGVDSLWGNNSAKQAITNYNTRNDTLTAMGASQENRDNDQQLQSAISELDEEISKYKDYISTLEQLEQVKGSLTEEEQAQLESYRATYEEMMMLVDASQLYTEKTEDYLDLLDDGSAIFDTLNSATEDGMVTQEEYAAAYDQVEAAVRGANGITEEMMQDEQVAGEVMQAVNAILEEYGITMENVGKTAGELAAANGESVDSLSANATVLKETADALGDVSDAYDQLDAIAQEYNSTGEITLESLNDLISTDASYIQYLDIVNGKMVVNKEGLDALAQSQKDEAIATIYANAQKEIEAIVAGTAAENENDLTTATKNSGDAAEGIVTQLGDASKGYITLGASAAAARAAMVSSATDGKKVTEEMQEQINKVIEQADNLAITVSNIKIGGGSTGSGSGSSKKSGSSSSSGKTAEEQALEAAKDAYDLKKLELEAQKDTVELSKTALENQKDLLELDKSKIELEQDKIEAKKEQVELEKDLLEQEQEEIQTAEESIESLMDMLQQMNKQLLEMVKSGISLITDNLQDQRDALEDQRDAYEKNIEAQQDSLDAAKDQLDAQKDVLETLKDQIAAQEEEIENQKTLQEKQDSVSDIQAQLNEIQYDDSADAQAKRQELLKELQEAKSNLEDEIRSQATDAATDAIDAQIDALDAQQDALDAQKDALDDDLDAYNDAMDEADKKLEDTQEALENFGDFISEVLESDYALYLMSSVELNAAMESGSDTLLNTLKSWNQVYGDHLDSTVTTAWDNATAAVEKYNTEVDKIDINKIQNALGQKDSELQTQINAKESEIQGYENQSAEYDIQITSLNNQISELEIQISEYETKMNELQLELDKLKVEYENQQIAIQGGTTATEANTTATTTNTEATTAQTTATTEQTTATTDNTTAVTDNTTQTEDLTEKQEDLEESTEDLKTDMDNADTSVENLNTNAQTTSGSIQTMGNTSATASTQIGQLGTAAATASTQMLQTGSDFSSILSSFIKNGLSTKDWSLSTLAGSINWSGVGYNLGQAGVNLANNWMKSSVDDWVESGGDEDSAFAQWVYKLIGWAHAGTDYVEKSNSWLDQMLGLGSDETVRILKVGETILPESLNGQDITGPYDTPLSMSSIGSNDYYSRAANPNEISIDLGDLNISGIDTTDLQSQLDNLKQNFKSQVFEVLNQHTSMGGYRAIKSKRF